MRILLVFLFISCAPYASSPFSDSIQSDERNLNGDNLKKIKNEDIEEDGKIRIAVFSDTHQNYVYLNEAINDINRTTNIDFVVSLGDVTNSGYHFEYDIFTQHIQSISKPFLNLLGNHDALGAGVKIYNKIFGNFNFYIETETQRFIFFHNNDLEDPKGFDPNWLKDRVEETPKKIVIFSHVHFEDSDRFRGDTRKMFDDIIQDQRVQVLFSGHNHVYKLSLHGETHLIQIPRIQGGHWILLEFEGNRLKVKRNDSGSKWLDLKP